MDRKSPIYNLKAVLKVTNLKADVLRAWERRYGLPSPQRTPGGHRLYSEYDVEIVQWLTEHVAQGLSISRAVELWKNLTEAGRDPLENLPAEKPSSSIETPNNGTRLEDMRRKWVEACLVYDNLTAEAILNQAFVLYSVEDVCFEILRKGITDIGNLWYHGKASVQQEHFASDIANRRLDALITATPNPIRTQTVLAGCPPGEWHTLPVKLLTLLMRRQGINVIFLGASIPLEQMAETVAAVRPSLIILAAQQLATAATLRSTAILFQKFHIPMAYGGLIFNRIPQLRKEIPAEFLGENLEDAVFRIEQLILHPTTIEEAAYAESPDRLTAALFRRKRPLIEVEVLIEMERSGLAADYIIEVSSYFSDGLLAAMDLGNVHHMDSDLDWVNQLLIDRKIPVEGLKIYLEAYRYAVSRELGEAGTVITDWIDSYLAQH